MTPKEAFEKCLNKKRIIPELEEIIATNPEYSFRYARFIIQGPFEKGHSIIFNSEYNKKKYIKFLKLINYDMTEISEWLL